ncbi:44501_t:CDS:2 [Gigaspora margarita]|uniref:44501_t:CDS:1 n=1 Tax=Gigaspora margarita TaxID=4874 RepID=A0ABN7U5S3_GIGMA|nr:44501_t:CDS:2 [Gigaspora margarita]
MANKNTQRSSDREKQTKQSDGRIKPDGNIQSSSTEQRGIPTTIPYF